MRSRQPAAPDLGPDQPVRERRLVLGMVLEVVGPHRPVLLVEHLALRRLVGSLPCVVGGGRRWQVEHFPAAELEAVAEVDVLSIHVVARVEEADAVQRRPPEHQAVSGAGVDLVDVRLVDIAHVVASETRALRKEAAEADRPIEEGARHREGAPRRGIEAAIRQMEPRSDRACVRAREHEISQAADTLRVDGDVGIQEQHEPAGAALEPDVGGAAEADVLLLDQHGRLWELGGDRRGRAVAGVVVNNHRLDWQVRGCEQGLHRLEEKVLDVVADDQCGDDGLWRIGHPW